MFLSSSQWQLELKVFWKQFHNFVSFEKKQLELKVFWKQFLNLVSFEKCNIPLLSDVIMKA